MIPALRRLRRDRRGIAALEFALVVPIILLMIAGTVEVGLMMMVDASLELGIRSASRYGLISGSNADSTTRTQAIRAAVVEAVGRWVPSGDDTSSNPAIVTKVYPSFDSIGEPEPYTDSNGNEQYDDGESFTDVNGNLKWDSDMGTSSAGGREAIVTYTVTLTRPGFSGVLGLVGLTEFSYTRTLVIQNE